MGRAETADEDGERLDRLEARPDQLESV